MLTTSLQKRKKKCLCSGKMQPHMAEPIRKKDNLTFGGKARKQTYLDNYDDCDKIISGEPAVNCINCGQLFPNLDKKNTGNRTMHDHLACCPKRKTGTGSGSTQARLTNLMVRVSVSFIIAQSVPTDHH